MSRNHRNHPLPRIDRRLPNPRRALAAALILYTAAMAGALALPATAGPALAAGTATLALAPLAQRLRTRAENAAYNLALGTTFGRQGNLTGFLSANRGVVVSPARGEIALYRRGAFEIHDARRAHCWREHGRHKLYLSGQTVTLGPCTRTTDFAREIRGAIARAARTTASHQAAETPDRPTPPARPRSIVHLIARRLQQHPAVAADRP